MALDQANSGHFENNAQNTKKGKDIFEPLKIFLNRHFPTIPVTPPRMGSSATGLGRGRVPADEAQGGPARGRARGDARAHVGAPPPARTLAGWARQRFKPG